MAALEKCIWRLCTCKWVNALIRWIQSVKLLNNIILIFEWKLAFVSLSSHFIWIQEVRDLFALLISILTVFNATYVLLIFSLQIQNRYLRFYSLQNMQNMAVSYSKNVEKLCSQCFDARGLSGGREGEWIIQSTLRTDTHPLISAEVKLVVWLLVVHKRATVASKIFGDWRNLSGQENAPSINSITDPARMQARPCMPWRAGLQFF